MVRIDKFLQKRRPSARYSSRVLPTTLAGLGLVGALGGLASLNLPLALFGGAAILLLAFVYTRPVLIVYGLTVLLPLTGGMARGGVVPLLRVGQALLVFGFILFVLARPAPQGKSRVTIIDLAFALFFMTEAVFPLLALYYAGGHVNFTSSVGNGVSVLQGLLGPIQYYLLYRIVVAVVSSKRQVRTLLNLMFATSIVVSIIGILEELRVGPIRTFLQANYPIPDIPIAYTSSSLRVASTLQHYSGLGAYMSFTLILLLACYLFQEQIRIPPLLMAATALFDSITLVLSGTFAAWIGLLVGVVLILILGRRLPKTLIFVAFGIALGVLVFQSFIISRLTYQFGQGVSQGLLPESFAYRITLWQQLTLPAIGQHLIFGAGPAPQVIATAGQAIEESQYFYLLLQGGLSYLLGYLLLIGVAIATCWRQIRSKKEELNWPVAIGLLAILVTINVMNISGEYFTYVGGTQTLWTLLAIVVASGQPKAVGPAVANGQMRNSSWRAWYKTPCGPLSAAAFTKAVASSDGLPGKEDSKV